MPMMPVRIAISPSSSRVPPRCLVSLTLTLVRVQYPTFMITTMTDREQGTDSPTTNRIRNGGGSCMARLVSAAEARRIFEAQFVLRDRVERVETAGALGRVLADDI